MNHKITNVNAETQTGDCAVCGTDVRLKKQYGHRVGTFRCYAKYQENKRRTMPLDDGTPVPAGYRDELFILQQGLCAICKEPMSAPHLDHCHDRKKLRELLCPGCNKGLGHFRDNIEYLSNAIAYLEKHSK
jgi:5-methylcytosine-specific restriction endonuclease McrA